MMAMDANGSIPEYRIMLNRPEQKRAYSECGQSGDRDRTKQGKAPILMAGSERFLKSLFCFLKAERVRNNELLCSDADSHVYGVFYCV